MQLIKIIPKKLIKIIETYELYEFDKIRRKRFETGKKRNKKELNAKPKIKIKKRTVNYYRSKKRGYIVFNC